MKSRKIRLFMGTTKVSAEKTAGEIQQALVQSGARQIVSDYDEQGKVRGLRFVIESQGVPLVFALPVRVEPLVRRLRDKAQAERVAWRQLLRWVLAQMAMIEIGMVKAEEVYSPYVLDRSGKMLFESMFESRFKQIAGPAEG